MFFIEFVNSAFFVSNALQLIKKRIEHSKLVRVEYLYHCSKSTNRDYCEIENLKTVYYETRE